MTDENNQIKFFLYENWARTKTGQHTVIIKCWPILHFILAICSRRQLILRASISALVPLYLRFIYLDLWFLLFRIALLTKADIVSLKKKKAKPIFIFYTIQSQSRSLHWTISAHRGEKTLGTSLMQTDK